MIVQFQSGTSEETVRALCAGLEREGVRVTRSRERSRPIVALAGKLEKRLVETLRTHPSVACVVDPMGEIMLVARAMREAHSVVTLGKRTPVSIGGGDVVVIAGPCSVESRDHVNYVAHEVRSAGAQILRGGAFKPRTSPYQFQGLGVEGLRQLKDAGLSAGMPVVSEIMDASDLPQFLEHDIDCLQIGARNMQNFTLLKSVAKCGRPILLKRGLAATVEEWLYAAEYLAAGGANDIILCERGIRTFEKATRNTLDLTIVPLLREWTHLPVIVDPAHAAGIARIVPALSRAAIAVGADGVAVEVHENPSAAKSDGPQALLPAELVQVISDACVQAAVTGRRFHP